MQITSLEHLNTVDSNEIQGAFGRGYTSYRRNWVVKKPSYKPSYKPSKDIDIDIDVDFVKTTNVFTNHQTMVIFGHGHGYQKAINNDGGDDIN